MQRHSTGRFYLNFTGLGDDGDLVRQALGDAPTPGCSRSSAGTTRRNLFHLNQNIKPARS